MEIDEKESASKSNVYLKRVLEVLRRNDEMCLAEGKIQMQAMDEKETLQFIDTNLFSTLGGSYVRG